MIGRILLRTALRVGRGTALALGVGVMFAMVLGVASAALGANGGNFVLGQSNAATALTRLTGNVQGAAMQVINNNPGADDTALNLQVQQGEAPMRVNSDELVTNLNADKLDSKDSSDFMPAESHAVKEDFFVSSRTEGAFTADCDLGDVAITGGYSILREESLILEEKPSEFSERTWVVHLRTGALSESLDVHVRCADLPPLRT